jgi:hypothetical protein
MNHFSVFLNPNISRIIKGYDGSRIVDDIISDLKIDLKVKKKYIFDEIRINLTQETTIITLISGVNIVKIPILIKKISELTKIISEYKNIFRDVIYVHFQISNNYLDLFLKIYEVVKSKNISVEFFKDIKQVYDFYIDDPTIIQLPPKTICYTNRYYKFDRFPTCKYELVNYIGIDFFQDICLLNSYRITFNKCIFDPDYITLSFKEIPTSIQFIECKIELENFDVIVNSDRLYILPEHRTVTDVIDWALKTGAFTILEKIVSDD